MRLTSALTLTIALVGCASSQSQTAVGGGASGRWSATLQQTQQRTGELAPTGQQKATGTVQLTPSAGDPGRMMVQITLSAPGNSSSTLRWAIFPGRCGSNALPLTGIEAFPTIDVGSNGRGQIAGEIPVRLESGAMYHVNVFKGRGTDLSDVLTCGNLRAG